MFHAGWWDGGTWYAPGLWIAAQWYGPVLEDAHGQPLPHLEGCTIVADGEVVLASTAPHSLDARYFGVTRVVDLTAHAVPLLTWR